MAVDYKAQKAAQRKTGNKALWLLIVILVVVVAMIVKIMFANDLKADSGFSGLPTSDEAYTVAKELVRPTLKSSSAKFDDSFQFGKGATDSVYVIQSSVDTRDANNEKIVLKFKIVLQYKGGSPDKTKNWDLVNLDTN